MRYLKTKCIHSAKSWISRDSYRNYLKVHINTFICILLHGIFHIASLLALCLCLSVREPFSEYKMHYKICHVMIFISYTYRKSKNHVMNDRLLCYILSFIIFPVNLVQLLVYHLDVDVINWRHTRASEFIDPYWYLRQSSRLLTERGVQ